MVKLQSGQHILGALLFGVYDLGKTIFVELPNLIIQVYASVPASLLDINTDLGECRGNDKRLRLYGLNGSEAGDGTGMMWGIEWRAAYQREKLMDPLRIQTLLSESHAGSASNITYWENPFQIEDALSRLSARERECYVQKHGQCFSFEEIANMLQISKRSVEQYVNQAQKKVAEEVETSLFLRGYVYFFD